MPSSICGYAHQGTDLLFGAIFHQHRPDTQLAIQNQRTAYSGKTAISVVCQWHRKITISVVCQWHGKITISVVCQWHGKITISVVCQWHGKITISVVCQWHGKIVISVVCQWHGKITISVVCQWHGKITSAFQLSHILECLINVPVGLRLFISKEMPPYTGPINWHYTFIKLMRLYWPDNFFEFKSNQSTQFSCQQLEQEPVPIQFITGKASGM